MGKHHVPRKYLAGFATREDGGQIWMYDAQTRRWSLAAIGKVAQQRNYFDAKTESTLARSVEGPAHEVLGKLRKLESISAQERDAVARYVAVMLMRVPRRRRHAGALVVPTLRRVLDQRREQLRSELNGPTDQARLEARLRAVDRVEREFTASPPDAMVAYIRSPWPTERILAAVRDMAWRFVYSSGPRYFLTSDNPVHFFEALGIGTRDAELTFAISSDVALLESWQGERGSTAYLHVMQPIVREVNRRVASGAERFVFYHARKAWIESLCRREDARLIGIRWT